MIYTDIGNSSAGNGAVQFNIAALVVSSVAVVAVLIILIVAIILIVVFFMRRVKATAKLYTNRLAQMELKEADERIRGIYMT